MPSLITHTLLCYGKLPQQNTFRDQQQYLATIWKWRILKGCIKRSRYLACSCRKTVLLMIFGLLSCSGFCCSMCFMSFSVEDWVFKSCKSHSYVMYRLRVLVVLGNAEHHCSTSGTDLNLNKKIHSLRVLWPQKRVLSVTLVNFWGFWFEMCAGRERINCKSWTFNCYMINTSVSQSNPVVYLQLKNTGTPCEVT